MGVVQTLPSDPSLNKIGPTICGYSSGCRLWASISRSFDHRRAQSECICKCVQNTFYTDIWLQMGVFTGFHGHQYCVTQKPIFEHAFMIRRLSTSIVYTTVSILFTYSYFYVSNGF